MKYNARYSHPGQLIRKGMKSSFVLGLLMACALYSKAQLTPFQSMYYQNRYLSNPAMAGVDKYLNLELDYRRQWSEFPGMPRTGSFTLDFQPTDKVGLGFNITDGQAGLLRSTRFVGTYAYHLPLGDQNERLNFGLSLGLNDSRVNTALINGDASDQEIALYNQTKPYVDGDLGIAYTSNNFYIGGALPNMRSTIFKSTDNHFDADMLLFIAMTSYKIPLQSDDRAFTLEPLAAFRVVKGYNDIVDGGFNFIMNNYGLYLQGIYHSNETFGAGFGLDQQSYSINFSYNMETGVLSNFTNGAFEIGIRLRLGKKQP
jgi:type IX secretion system PorP/SprF family membrane protein